MEHNTDATPLMRKLSQLGEEDVYARVACFLGCALLGGIFIYSIYLGNDFKYWMHTPFLKKISLASFVVGVPVVIYGAYIAWHHWENKDKINIFLCLMAIFFVIRGGLELYSTLIRIEPTNVYWQVGSTAKLGRFFLMLVPIAALWPRLRELQTMDFIRKNTQRVHQMTVMQAAAIKDGAHHMQEGLSKEALYHAQEDVSSDEYKTVMGDEPIGTLPIELLVGFIGKNAAYFIPRFRRFAMQGGGVAASWNWSGFFFPQAWFFYRKMYLAGTISLLVTFSGFGWIVCGIVVGIFGNSWYYMHCVNKILHLRSVVKEEDLLKGAELAGGTSMGLAILVTVVPIIVLLIFALAPFFILNMMARVYY